MNAHDMKEDIGKTFTRLTILSLKKDNDNRTLFVCTCSCGKKVTLSASKIRAGSKKSCGCLLKEHRMNFLAGLSKGNKPVHTLPIGESAAGYVYRNYKSSAKKRELEFSIEKEDFLRLTKLNCHYCNAAPYTVMKADDGKRRLNGDYIYNGLDRMDSNQGYTLANIVTCCRLCNRLKGDLISYDEFIKIVELLKISRGPDIWSYYLKSDSK